MANRWLVFAGTGWLLWASAAQGGLYNLSEPNEGKLDVKLPYVDGFRGTLLALQSIASPKVDVDRPLRKRYLLQADLALKAPSDGLTEEQQLNLAAVLLRRREVDRATKILEKLTRRNPKNFLALSNLATAYHLGGQPQRAYETLGDALAAWPKSLEELPKETQQMLFNAEWHGGALDFYRTAETYFRKLLRQRMLEANTKKPFDQVDALFDDGASPSRAVRYVGENGEFFPGGMAAAEKAKLHKNALDIVQQLLVWLPEDPWLLWQLGELYNAKGDLASARIIFDEVKEMGVRTPEFWKRRQVLLNTPDAPTEDGAGLENIEKNLKKLEQKRAAEAGIDWRTLMVGFGVGMVVALFASWQIREIRRRHTASRGRQPSV